jgi:CPA2 family monovalent cation:H+ antiporter-2
MAMWSVSRFVASEDAEGLLLGVLGLTLVVAGLAASVNISAAVGAFLVGIAISGPVVENVATKIITGYFAAKRARIAILGRWRAGLALTPRGEFSVVIAGLAIAAGAAAQLA